MRAQSAAMFERRTETDVAVSRLGIRRLNAERHEIAVLCELLGQPQRLLEATDIFDHVVGGERTDHRLGVARDDQGGGQADRGSGAPARRLGDDVLPRQLEELGANRLHIVARGDDVQIVQRHEWCDAVDGFLQHGPWAPQLHELLGRRLRAEWPEAWAAGSGTNRWMHAASYPIFAPVVSWGICCHCHSTCI